MPVTADPRSSAAPSPEATGSACVFVVGMHRSGTSAATEVLARLGLHPPEPGDRFETTQWNERGNWESRSLTSFNKRLLERLGGSWSVPPELDPDWEAHDALADDRAEGARIFAGAYPRRPLAWKDPQLCLVLPFWRRVVPGPHAALLVYRDPLEVAGSLSARNGLPELHGLALWERYVRAACTSLHGVPTLACDSRQLVEDPSAWGGRLQEFVSSIGVIAPHVTSDGALGSLDPHLRHQRPPAAGRAGPARDARTLFDALRVLDGIHHRWQAPDLGAEPPWVAEVLGLCRETQRTRRALRAARSSRAYRLAGWLRRAGERP